MKYLIALAALAASMTAASAAPLPCYSQLFFGNVLPKICPAGTNSRFVGKTTLKVTAKTPEGQTFYGSINFPQSVKTTGGMSLGVRR